jgi:Xaa-Pro aminopeptidase
VLGKTVDEAGRKIITKAGYGKNFGHGTGHGIGFFVHVGPSLSSISEDKLKPNNIITVEPGIYISGWGGVRIEDDVVVTRTGHRILNKSPKKLLEL